MDRPECRVDGECTHSALQRYGVALVEAATMHVHVDRLMAPTDGARVMDLGAEDLHKAIDLVVELEHRLAVGIKGVRRIGRRGHRLHDVPHRAAEAQSDDSEAVGLQLLSITNGQAAGRVDYGLCTVSDDDDRAHGLWAMLRPKVLPGNEQPARDARRAPRAWS